MRFLQRTLLLAFFIALGTWLFYIGREHKVFLDNKTLDHEGQTFKALKYVNVTVNNTSSPVELMAKDRDVVKSVGALLKVQVDVMDEFGENVEKTISFDFNLGFRKDIMLSLPLIASGQNNFVLPAPTVHQRITDGSREIESDDVIPKL